MVLVICISYTHLAWVRTLHLEILREIDCNSSNEPRYEDLRGRSLGSIKHVESINKILEQSGALNLIVYRNLEISSYDHTIRDDLGSKEEDTS